MLHGLGCLGTLVFLALIVSILLGGTGCTATYTSSQTPGEEWADLHADDIIKVRKGEVKAQPGDWLLLPRDAHLQENTCAGKVTLFNVFITEKKDDISQEDTEPAAWIEVENIHYSDDTVTFVNFHFVADENCTGVVSDGLLKTADS
jgi:hypothetical protein